MKVFNNVFITLQINVAYLLFDENIY